MNRNLEQYMENLGDEDFFQRFTQRQLNEIISESIIHQHLKGQIIFFQGDPSIYCHYVLDGLIRIEKTSQFRDSFYVDYIKTGSFFSYGSLFREAPYSSSAYAVTEVDVLLIPRKILEGILQENIDQLLYMSKKMAKTINFLENRIQANAIPSASDRVVQSLAIWLVDLGKPAGGEIIIPYPLTINELSQIAGTTRETAGRIVKSLTEENKIDLNRQRILYKDPEYFEKLLK